MESDALTWGDKLILRGLSFHGFHGAKPEERMLGQKFLVDIDAWMDLKAAGKTDHLSDTVSYTEIYDVAKEVLEGSPQNLLESVAQKIAITTLTNHKEISAVRVKVGKPHVAVWGPVDYLGVEILRRRSDLDIEMAKKGNIVQYRQRLDNTLALPDLTNHHILKTLVKSQLQRSSKVEIEGCNEKEVETKTSELCNFLDMLRSASGDNTGGSSTSHSDWKLKQDNEEFRVMYREGPEGTPFHTLLVEGYVDGPLDLGESFMPFMGVVPLQEMFTIPSFKVLVSDRLQRVRIGEQISLVRFVLPASIKKIYFERMKVPWPLSTREAIVHYYLFEYFQDDLVVVLLNTVPESMSIDGFNKDSIPESEDVVRIDLVGGYVMQKVTSERSYFRIIANLDLKLDFVPPTLLNFIARQLIGSGFRLYQKAVASMMGHDKDKDFSKALEDSLYVRIREALLSVSGSKAKDGEELKRVASIVPAEELVQSEDGAKDVSCEDSSNQCANNYNGESLDARSEEVVEEDCKEIVQIEEEDVIKVVKGKENGEIVDADNEEIVEIDSEEIVQIEKDVNKVHDIPVEEGDTRSVLKGMNIRSDVRRAVETIERVISMVQEYGFHSLMSTSNSADEESHCKEKGGTVDSNSAKIIQVCLKNEVSVQVSSSNTLEETSEEIGRIQNFRHTGANPNVKEVNYKKVVPTSPEQNLSRPIEASQGDSYSLKNGTILDHTICDNKQLNNDAVQVSTDDLKKSSREIKYRYCCFMY
ncbi:Dihydroneopterin aldolase 2 [Mucuna pruriens]|uniref:7,8-dihydroneopterin aldolase n=1 Tax=Mucuna pruriens TaxID=157652 RepID=A0A371FDS6_MUCPR|nr:Dihydroneopterin aldolase 2 [Mucuna pruriens]